MTCLCLRVSADSRAPHDFSGPELAARARVRGNWEAAVFSELEVGEDRAGAQRAVIHLTKQQVLLTSQACEKGRSNPCKGLAQCPGQSELPVINATGYC